MEPKINVTFRTSALLTLSRSFRAHLHVYICLRAHENIVTCMQLMYVYAIEQKLQVTFHSVNERFLIPAKLFVQIVETFHWQKCALQVK